MTRGFILTMLVGGAAFGQSGPSFEAADVHVSPPSNSFNVFLRGPFVRAGRYEMRTASMLDLISTAYSMDGDRVYGGPNWLEMDRYDVIGKPPTGATRDAENGCSSSSWPIASTWCYTRTPKNCRFTS